MHLRVTASKKWMDLSSVSVNISEGTDQTCFTCWWKVPLPLKFLPKIITESLDLNILLQRSQGTEERIK